MSKIETNQVDPSTGTTLTLGTSGDTIAIPSGVTIANSGTATGFGGANTPNFEARKGDSNQSINHDTSTKVTFNNETFDTASAYASDKFTVPSGQGGKYFIYASVAWNNDDNGRRAVFLYKNGSETKRLYETDAGSTDAAHVSAGALLNLSASDYIEVYCYQTSGSAENVLANNEMTYFGGFKIIE